MIERDVRIAEPYSMAATLRPLQHGPRDQTTRIGDAVAWRAVRTPLGGATIRFARVDGGVRVSAWGPGAEAAVDGAPAMLGVEDDPAAYAPSHPLLRELARRFVGVRFPKTRSIMDALLPAILEQKVTSGEAFASYNAIMRRWGEPAPGPDGLRLPPDPAGLAAEPYFAFHRLGVERRRADVIRRATARAARLEEAATLPPAEACARLRAIPGIGAWTAAEVTRVSHGDPDAVSVGDFHIPNTVCWALAGEPRGDDARMLELLDGETGHRGRAIRLLELAGYRAPAFGPKHRRRSIASI